MKLISQNLPGSNYASDKPKEVLVPHPQRSSAMKAKDTSLPNIQEENEYDEIINRTPVPPDSLHGGASELDKRRNHR